MSRSPSTLTHRSRTRFGAISALSEKCTDALPRLVPAVDPRDAGRFSRCEQNAVRAQGIDAPLAWNLVAGLAKLRSSTGPRLRRRLLPQS